MTSQSTQGADRTEPTTPDPEDPRKPDDPTDLETFGRAVTELLGDPEERERLGRNARDRASEHFLPDRHLLNYAHLLDAMPA